MEAPPGPLRSPDGLWWWDGKGWQPIATLAAQQPAADVWQPPADAGPAASPAPPGGEAPSAGAWQPPPGIGQPPAPADPPPPATTPAAAPEAPASGSWQPPGTGAWQPPGSTPEVEPSAAPDAAPESSADSVWDMPPAPGQAATMAAAAAAAEPPAAMQAAPAPSDPPLAAIDPPQAVAPFEVPPQPSAGAPPPVVLPPPPPAAEPPKPEVALPNWLPRNEHSEAVVQSVPTRVVTGAAKPGAAMAQPPQVQVPAGARSSGWVSQLYPAGAALNANRRLVAYAGLAILGLIALYVLWQAVAGLNLFGGGLGGATPDNSPTGTQFAQADGFLVGSMNPALASVATAVKPIPVDCTGAHSVTCRNTLDDADTAVVKAIAVIDKGPFPGCLAASVVQTRRDLVNLDQALKGALIGFRYNTDALVTKGLADFTAVAPTLKTDGDALKASEVSSCPKTP